MQTSSSLVPLIKGVLSSGFAHPHAYLQPCLFISRARKHLSCNIHQGILLLLLFFSTAKHLHSGQKRQISPLLRSHLLDREKFSARILSLTIRQSRLSVIMECPRLRQTARFQYHCCFNCFPVPEQSTVQFSC